MRRALKKVGFTFFSAIEAISRAVAFGVRCVSAWGSHSRRAACEAIATLIMIKRSNFTFLFMLEAMSEAAAFQILYKKSLFAQERKKT